MANIWTPYILCRVLTSSLMATIHSWSVLQLVGDDETIIGHLPWKISSICSILKWFPPQSTCMYVSEKAMSIVKKKNFSWTGSISQNSWKYFATKIWSYMVYCNISDRIWENPPYGICVWFAQCAFLVTGQKLSKLRFCHIHVRNLSSVTVVYGG